jgi:16S rRNA G966 N2-methylase RsmD
LRYLEKWEDPFHLVFIDPPYRLGLVEEVLEYLSASALIDEKSIVIAEFSAGEVIPAAFAALGEFDRRLYGDTCIALFHKIV